MPGPTIQWTPIDTAEVISEIREEGRYRLANPSAVKGAPSLAMQAAGQNCTVKVYIGGVYRSDALLTVPSAAPVAIRNAVGQPLTGQEMFDMVIEVGNLGFGSVILTTDEPNGSPSAPFTTVGARNAAAPFAANSVVFVAGSPAAVGWRLKAGVTGAVDADWVTEMAIVADDAAAEALLAVAGNGSSCITVAGAIWARGA